MFVGYGALELHLPFAPDLKTKRRIVHGLVERLHSRFRLSVAETGLQELLQRAEIGVAVVARDAAAVERILEQVGRLAESGPDAVVVDWSPVVIEGHGEVEAADDDGDDGDDEIEGRETER